MKLIHTVCTSNKKEEVKITINILEFEFITTKKRRTEHHVRRASIVVVN